LKKLRKTWENLRQLYFQIRLKQGDSSHICCWSTKHYTIKFSHYYENCLLQQVIERRIKGGIEVTGRRGRRRRKLKERRGYSYLKEEALDRTMWKARFG
jgi:hypothetical protein